MKKMTRILGITIIAAVGLAACGQTSTDHKNHESTEEKKTEQKEMNQGASNDLLTTSLKNVTRLNTNDPLQMAVLTSQTIWPKNA